MDLVYICRPGENEELRYSLRSVAANLPHNRVWVFGDGPDWLSEKVHLIKRSQDDVKYWNAMANMRAAVRHPRVSETFILMNDDMFVMAPHPDGAPTQHWGALTMQIARHAALGHGFYLKGMKNTLSLLERRGHVAPLSYELHTPMVMTKAGARAVDDIVHANRSPLHNRTLYGNLFGIGGEYADDVKVYNSEQVPSTGMLSTTDESFRKGKVGARIRNTFAEPSMYER